MFEKKRGKRFLASVMAIVMLLSLDPVGALAADETPTNEECSAMPLPAGEDDNQQAVADKDKNTPTTQPAVDPKPVVADPVGSSSEAVILPEGDPLDQDFSVNPDTSNSNDIAEHKGGNKDNRELVTTDSTPKYVIRFYVSQTGTENSYTEENKYTVVNQPDSNKEEDNLELSVSPGYAILTGYNDVATGIDWQNFTQVNETGDEAVKAWLNQHASKGVPAGLTDSATVDEIVRQVNEQYQENNKGYDLPQLQENYFTGFEFVEAKYVGSGESSIHVHVRLKRNPEYVTRTVHYKANNGTEKEGSDSKIYEKTATATATVKENMFTWAGHKFTGWNTKEDGTGTNYSPKSSIQFNDDTDVTLYAQWEAKKYKVSYDLNYTDATNSLEAKTDVKWGDNNLLPDDSNPIRDGYSFAGWYTQATAGTEVTDVTTYASIAGNDATPSVTLYAHWNQDSKPTTESTPVYIYFKIVDAAGNNIKDKSKINNDDLKNTACNNDADKKTWATLGKIASAGTLTDGTEYKGINATLVTVGNEAKDQLKNDDALHTDNKKIANTVLANIEWFQLKQWNGATDYVALGTQAWHLDGKITGYTVTYNKGTTEATNDVHNMPGADEMYYLSGSEYTVSDATPTRDGYVFTGWKSDNDNKVYDSESKMIMPAKNVVLTAQWEKDELVDPSVGKPEGITKGDGIADKYQIQVSFEAMNGTFEGCTSPDNQYTTVVTKYDNYTNMPSENGTAKLANEHLKAATPNENHNLTGWTKNSTKCEIPKLNDIVTHGDHFVVTFEKKENPPIVEPTTKINYTINQHFMNGKGEKDSALDKPGTTQSADKDTALSNLIENLVKNQTIGNDKDNYMYVSGKYTTKSESQKDQPITSESKLTEDTTIDLYYYLDNWKDGSSVEEDNDKGGDGIPDCDQVLIKYVSSNSERGTVSPDMEVLTLRKDNENVQIKINGSKATDNGGRNYFSNWTEDNTQVSTNATLNHQTILDVIKEFTGGKTYTFTANFGYSSGGGSGGSNRPKPPVVDIPDDVPTGLNGKDHYAYIIGYGNNDVRPQNNITRAEVATIFFRLLTDETRTANMTKSNGYNDVKDGDWFCCAVSTLSKMGIIKGYEDGSFKPNDPISRAEFAAIAARFDPDGDKTPASFADVTSHWAKDEISIAANHGWIKGYEDGSFKPDQKITRAETMTLVNRVLNRLPETKDDLHKDMKTWVDNMDETAWYYLAVQEATNSHYFKNKTGTKFEQWTDLRDTRDWSELEK